MEVAESIVGRWRLRFSLADFTQTRSTRGRPMRGSCSEGSSKRTRRCSAFAAFPLDLKTCKKLPPAQMVHVHAHACIYAQVLRQIQFLDIGN